MIRIADERGERVRSSSILFFWKSNNGKRCTEAGGGLPCISFHLNAGSALIRAGGTNRKLMQER